MSSGSCNDVVASWHWAEARSKGGTKIGPKRRVEIGPKERAEIGPE